TALKIPRLQQCSFVDPYWQRTLPQWVFLMDIAARSRWSVSSQFEQSLAVVRVGWNFKSFFLAPAAPGGLFLLSEAESTTSGTPNLIIAFSSPCPVRPGLHRWHKKAACRDSFGNPAL